MWLPRARLSQIRLETTSKAWNCAEERTIGTYMNSSPCGMRPSGVVHYNGQKSFQRITFSKKPRSPVRKSPCWSRKRSQCKIRTQRWLSVIISSSTLSLSLSLSETLKISKSQKSWRVRVLWFWETVFHCLCVSLILSPIVSFFSTTTMIINGTKHTH